MAIRYLLHTLWFRVQGLVMTHSPSTFRIKKRITNPHNGALQCPFTTHPPTNFIFLQHIQIGNGLGHEKNYA